MNSVKRWVALALIMVLTLGLLSGCGSSTKKEDAATEAPTEAPEATPEVSVAPSNEINETEPVSADDSGVIAGLSDVQKNSLNMLNYLAFTTQEILSKKNNRVYLEQVYTAMINDINPSSVNDYTESHYKEILGIIHDFEKLLKKRERLQYLFEQSQAQAMRNAIPNPIGLLSAVKSMNIASLVASVSYMAIDSISSYSSAMSEAEQAFLEASWELDDEESDTIFALRTQTFLYMVEVVKGYDLPDQLTLSEEKVIKLVEWNEKAGVESAASRVQFYETNEAEYEGFGQYWLARARAHYDNGEYEDCLKSIRRYEELNIGIYRKDYELANVLPIAIGAASQIYDDNTYVEVAGRYADMIIQNTDIENDWAVRYFAAQTYIDIYSRTNEKAYLEKAYKVALDNANELKVRQKELNHEYISDVKIETVPQGSTEEKKKQIEAYNKQKKTERKTELPPVYEPLKLNLDLLYALAKELEMSEADIGEMEAILYINGEPLFLSKPINALYRTMDQTEEPEITFDGKNIKIPAIYLTHETKITMTITEKAGERVIDDWVISKVDRKQKDDASSYLANWHSKKTESYNYTKAKELTIRISCFGTDDGQEYIYHYKVKNSKEWIVFDKSSFELIK